MFFYPDPEPIGHCITDVSPSYLTDGIFFNGKIGPTHKCIGKQLSAIPRGPNDPVAQRSEVNPRTLENWTINSKAWYVDNCGRNANALYAMMGLLPKVKIDLYAGWKSKVALFPRSEQYEYWYIKNARLKKRKTVVEKDFGINESLMPTPAIQDKETPAGSQDDVKKCGRIPRRCGLQLLDESVSQNNGAYGETKHTGKNEMLVGLDGADPVKVRIHVEGEQPKDLENRDCPRPYNPHKLLKGDTEKEEEDVDDAEDLKKIEVEDDPRWNSLQNRVWDVPRTEEQRKIAMLNLYKPYRHEMNTWYSRNKPTKLLPMIISEGKRPIIDAHFSNL